MKIRIKGNTLRLRLSQSEIRDLGQTGQVSEIITFSPNQHLEYLLTSSPDAEQVRATYADHRITVFLPEGVARKWIEDDQQISISGEQGNGSDRGLSLLIEKDFRCLTDRPHENEEDLFPHPRSGELNC